MIICGDVGGTKALLGVAEVEDGVPRLVQFQRYECAEFASFGDLMTRFRDDISAHAGKLTAACLALAGPIDDGARSAKITNLPWTVDAAASAAPFGLQSCILANDFEAAAAGITAVAPSELVTLQAGEPRADGVRLVVGAGTGLGMAVLVPHEGRFKVLPGEGGHVGFSPQDQDQLHVLAALRPTFGRVTTERVVSGPGLAAIHRVLAAETAEPATIAERALAGDAVARRSVDCFLSAYGAYASDMALAVLARGGVFLAGGIAAKILPLMQSGLFIQTFKDKAGHASLAARMPVHVVTDTELGLKGAALIGAGALDS
jgi:glucokinase